MQPSSVSTARFSKLAIISLMIAVLLLVHILIIFVDAFRIGMFGSSDAWAPLVALLSWVVCFLSILTGHIAAMRIKHSGGFLRGKWIARSAYILAYAWLVFLLGGSLFFT